MVKLNFICTSSWTIFIVLVSSNWIFSLSWPFNCASSGFLKSVTFDLWLLTLQSDAVQNSVYIQTSFFNLYAAHEFVQHKVFRACDI